MNNILVIAEHAEGQLSTATAHTMSAAAALHTETIDVLVLADQVDAIAAEAATIKHVSRVLTIARPENAHPLAAVLAPQISKVAPSYSHVFFPSTTFGKDLAPRVAALLGAPQISDITSVESARVFKHPIYAGNAIVTVEVAPSQTIVATIRTAAWQPAPGGNKATVKALSLEVNLPTHTRYLGLQSGKSDRPDLQSADKVVSGGRGIGSKENFDLIFKLADNIGAAVGASRAAVDAGYAANDLQVGQTGKIIAPQLYMAIGISGAIQHLTGIKDARTIVAINKDSQAPIFEVADIGLVGDLFKILPELEAALS